MIKVIDCGLSMFQERISKKRVFVFGAGRALAGCINVYFDSIDIELIIDNSSDLWGKSILHRGKEVKIVSFEEFVKTVHNSEMEQNVLFVSPRTHLRSIVMQLDSDSRINGINTFFQVLIKSHSEPIDRYDFSSGNQLIPKKIHYIWLGEKTLPYEYQKNIESWRKYNPDYEIIRWDESNIDFDKCDYAKEAFESRAYGFAVNYPRLDIIYSEGGIYLDVDVKAINCFDKLLNDKAFFNMGATDRINQGCGFGAVQGAEIVKKMKDAFNGIHFLNSEGRQIKQSSHSIISYVLLDYGFKIENQYQNREGIALYPNEVMSPFLGEKNSWCLSNKTVSIHYENGSWKNENEKDDYEIVKFLRSICIM